MTTELTEEQLSKLKELKEEFIKLTKEQSETLHNEHINFFIEVYDKFAISGNFFKIRIKRDKAYEKYIFNGNDDYCQTSFWDLNREKLKKENIEVWNRAKTYFLALNKTKDNKYYLEVILHSPTLLTKKVKEDILDKLELEYEYKEYETKNEGRLNFISEKRNSIDSYLINLIDKFNNLFNEVNYIDSIKYNDFLTDFKKRLNFKSKKIEEEQEEIIKDLKEEKIEMNNESKLLEKKNQIILYGPPGTGKTYNTKKIVENFSGLDYEDLNEDDKVKFITFHQSYAYEEFIEGLKPVIGAKINKLERDYIVESGMFKKFCESIILKQIKNSNYFSEDFEKIKNFNSLYSKLLETLEDKRPTLKTKKGKKFTIVINENENINCLPEGSSAENPYYLVSKDRLKKLFDNQEKIKSVTSIKQIIGGAHYSYYYTILKELNKQKPDSDNEVIEINDTQDLITKFYNLTKDKRESLFEKANPYFFVIDEINRGNISKIFGELITLLECNKRLGRKDELIIELPYSKEKFGIPPNLYVIATMNTTDKSIANLDLALRRRFGFIEMPPITELEEISRDCENIDLQNLLFKINQRIKVVLDKDHLIGHSYFLGIENLNDLKDVFYNEIIPLLEEYFYGDFEKMKAVLGSGFFIENKTKNGIIFESEVLEELIEDNEELELIDFRKKDFSSWSFEDAIKKIFNINLKLGKNE